MDTSLVIEPTMDYDFSKLYFGPPTTLTSGAYFVRILHNTNKSLFIQTPKSLTKQGFIKSGKKVYTDLMFDNNDTMFINWIENLESRCQELVYLKRETWFESNLEKDDIENAFTTPFKIFKSGKHYLLRVNVKPNVKIYNEVDEIVDMTNVSSDKTIISILEIQGLKFTSRNFQIEIELKQAMIVSPDPFLDECFIKKPVNKQSNIVKEEKQNSIEEKINMDDLINKSVECLTNKNNLIDLDVLNESEPKQEHVEEKIELDVEEIMPEHVEEEDTNILKEVNVLDTLDNNLETITLKKPNQVYYEIYKKARDKAKEAKKNALVAFLEMKNIKKTYMLDDIDESDSEFEDFIMEDNEDLK
jgi:hypothetical protein